MITIKIKLSCKQWAAIIISLAIAGCILLHHEEAIGFVAKVASGYVENK